MYIIAVWHEEEYLQTEDCIIINNIRRELKGQEIQNDVLFLWYLGV